jgi:hypothetical protein
MTTILEIHLTDGRVIRDQADFGKGSPADPMSWEEVAEKFTSCARYGGLAAPAIADVIAMVADLPSLPDVSRLTARLTVS